MKLNELTKHLLTVLLWLSIVTIFLGMNLNFFPLPYAILSTIITTSIILASIGINAKWLFRYFYLNNRRTKFLLYTIITSIVLAILHTLINKLLDPHRLFDSPLGTPFLFQLVRNIAILILANAINSALLLSNELKVRAENEKRLKEDKLGTELKLLKAQINPHFIFNALNNIYSLTYTKSENAADSVIKLSEMLRYVLDDRQQDQVLLTDEITYIENFISFQRMKSEHQQHIDFNYDPTLGDELINPMLLIPFIENSFKYSKIEEDKDAYVNISINNIEKGLSFKVSNSLPNSSLPLSGSGMGINNVKNRLELLYSDKHQLEIHKGENTFSVTLQLELQ